MLCQALCDRHALAPSIQGALQEAEPLLRTETTLGNAMAKKSRSGAAQPWAAVLREGRQWLSLI